MLDKIVNSLLIGELFYRVGIEQMGLDHRLLLGALEAGRELFESVDIEGKGGVTALLSKGLEVDSRSDEKAACIAV